MTVLVPGQIWDLLSQTLGSGAVESAGVALAHALWQDGRVARLLVREVRLPQRGNFLRREPYSVELSPSFVAATVAEARARGMSPVFFHTHPFSEEPHFSETDDKGEKVLLEFVRRRMPGVPSASLVLGTQRPAARLLGERRPVDVVVVGPCIRRYTQGGEAPAARSGAGDTAWYDRQVRAFGSSGQHRLAGMRVGVVGMGGTGSMAAEQLAHLGVGGLLLIDPDALEASNLNRVVGATAGDVGRAKVDVAGEHVRAINPSADVQCLNEDVASNAVLRKLRCLDAVICCTDSHGSRHVLNELAYRFLVPVFDCGVAVAAAGDEVTHIAGRAQMLAPGLPCLNCAGVLDAELVRRDLMPDSERAADPYFHGDAVPQPAVISLNGTVVSLVVTMFLSAFVGIPASARHQRYDAVRGVVRNISVDRVDSCVSCSTAGGLAVGDSWPLPGRHP